MAYNLNNKEIGISAEVAIADAFGLSVTPNYRNRGNEDIVKLIQPQIINIFKNEGIPNPIKHIAEGQNPVDFELNNNYTLSVKTNQQFSKKVAPQNVGQPTSTTYFNISRVCMEIIFLITITKDVNCLRV